MFKYVCSQVSTMAPSFLIVCKSIDSLVEHWLIQQFCTSLCSFLTEPPGHVIMTGDFTTVCFNCPSYRPAEIWKSITFYEVNFCRIIFLVEFQVYYSWFRWVKHQLLSKNTHMGCGANEPHVRSQIHGHFRKGRLWHKPKVLTSICNFYVST